MKKYVIAIGIAFGALLGLSVQAAPLAENTAAVQSQVAQDSALMKVYWRGRYGWRGGWRRPVYGWGWRGYGWRRPVYGWGWRGYGWRRPVYAYGWRRPVYGWRRPVYGWGWRRPVYGWRGGWHRGWRRW